MDEIKLIRQAVKGDKEAFSSLYVMYKDKLYKYAWYKLKNEEDASDAVADTVISAFKQIKMLRKATSFSSWLFSIHYATCNKYIKSQIDSRNMTEINDYTVDSGKTDFNIQAIELKEALLKLDEEERTVIMLSVVAGLKSSEISKIVGLTAGSVRSKQSRALKKMKTYLE